MTQIERQPVLARVAVLVEPRPVEIPHAFGEGSGQPGDLGLLAAFDTDHGRAEIGHVAPDHRARHDPGQVQHRDPVQRARDRGGRGGGRKRRFPFVGQPAIGDLSPALADGGGRGQGREPFVEAERQLARQVQRADPGHEVPSRGMGAVGKVRGRHDRGKHQAMLQRHFDRLALGHARQEGGDLGPGLFHLVFADLVVLDQRRKRDPIPGRELLGTGAPLVHQGKQVVGEPARRRTQGQVHFDQTVLDGPFRPLRARARAGEVQLLLLFRFHLGAKDIVRVADHRRHRQRQRALGRRGLRAGHHLLPPSAAAPRLERDHDPAERIRRRVVIRLRQAEPRRHAGLAFRRLEGSARGPEREVAVGVARLGPGQPEGRDDGVDHARIGRQQRIGVEKPGPARHAAFQHDIGPFDQGHDPRLIRGAVQDQGRPPRPVGGPEQRTAVVVEGRHGPCIGAARILDLKHLRPEDRQHPPRQHAPPVGQVQDPQTLKCSGHRQSSRNCPIRVGVGFSVVPPSTGMIVPVM